MPIEAVAVALALLNLAFAAATYLLNTKLEATKATAFGEAELRKKLEERVHSLESRRELDVDSIFNAIKGVGGTIAAFRESHMREMHNSTTEIRAEIARLHLLISTQYMSKEDCNRSREDLCKRFKP
jgi:hypothetical protein